MSAGDQPKVLQFPSARTSDPAGENTAANGVRSAEGVARPGSRFHPILEQQLLDALDESGRLELRSLLDIVSRQYATFDAERQNLEVVAEIASSEASELGEKIERESVTKLQLILDHVKDGILTCDHLGRVESMNRTAERFFGVSQAKALAMTIDQLLPDLAADGDVANALDTLAVAEDNTHYDLAARTITARHLRGDDMPAEILVSKVLLRRRPTYIVCLRDTLERTKSEVALKDSEARYRVLVENAPEAVVVFDVDRSRFVDCNDNAVRFFKMGRDQLLSVGPAEVSAEFQADGTPSFGIARGYVNAAIAGGTPVFEWLHRDADGRLIPCEVRFVILPSSDKRLIRASIIDITDRKRVEAVASGERRVFEKIASNATLSAALEAITEVIEQVIADAMCCIRLYEPQRRVLHHGAGPRLPREYLALMDEIPAEIRFGSCASSIALQRQIIVPDIDKDPFWEHRREAAAAAGLRACWSTPIRGSDGRLLGTFATYLKRTGLPSRRDLELMARMTQLSRIAIERRRAEDALRTSEQRFRGLFENVVEGVYQATLDGRILSANPALVQMLGFSSVEALQALPTTEVLYVDQSIRAVLMEQLEREGEVLDYEFELRRLDGRVITVSENARVMRDDRGRIVGVEGTISDVTERKRAEQKLFEEKERAQVTLQSIADAVITVDREGLIDYMNPVAETLTGWASIDARHQPVTAVVRLVHESNETPMENPVTQCLRTGEIVSLSDLTALVGPDGMPLAIQSSAAPIRDRQGELVGAVMVFHDVSRERRLRRVLSYQAAHDALTGLINRREFESRLTEAISAVRDDAELRHAMIYVDLDQFKVVNDTCGHPAGDQLLRQVTGLLQTRIRQSDVLARLGGDEFGILLEHCTPEQAVRIAEAVRQTIHEYRFEWQGNAMQIGASIGIVEISADTESVASLLSAADLACYSAKDGGRNRVQFYDRKSTSARHREMQWVSRLTRAADEGRLSLMYQPIVPVTAGGDQRPHYELLLRLSDDDGTLVPPNEFIPAAERYNVMPMLDRWVIEQVLAELIPSRTALGPPVGYTIAVNLSGTTLSDQTFLDYLIDRLDQHEPVPGTLCFEITETAAIANLANVSHFMRELRARGCYVSLDDFGTGLSSFSYLKTLPVDFIKIDGQFVQNVAHDPVDRSMVEAIVQVGRAMGISTIAERVETKDVLDKLRELGVGYAQGYLFARPAPLSEFLQRK